MSWHAHWFDGRIARAHAADVALHHGLLTIRVLASPELAGTREASFPIAALSLADYFPGAPRMISLPDGSSLQVRDDASTFDEALRVAGHRPSLVATLMRRWSSVAVCALLIAALVVWWDEVGVGRVADAAVTIVPSALEQRIGRSTLATLDGTVLLPTQTPAARIAQLRERFLRIVTQRYPGVSCELEFRGVHAAADSLNAFALPGGTIVVLDGLATKLSDDELLAVFGHELGHVVHRDPLHRMARQMGLLAVANVLWGDISTVLAGVAASVQGMPFARDEEAKADEFAMGFLKRAGLPPSTMHEALEVLARETRRVGEPPAFLSDHPALADRISATRAAERAP